MMQHRFKHPKSKSPSTSWEPVEKWYHEAVGEEGHHYHKNVILPNLLKMMALDSTSKPSVLDLACGQGILARHIPAQIPYLGIDISPSLIKNAKALDSNRLHSYIVGDLTKSLTIQQKEFTHASIILGIQNIEFPEFVFKNAFKLLNAAGKLFIVMNHPCFRIPRQSSWKVDEIQKIQYRRIDKYYSPMKIPIQTHPSKGEKSVQTWSFHLPLSSYSKFLREAGFCIESIEEWCSDKVSTGKAAKMENRSRTEFPLFLAIQAQKLPNYSHSGVSE